jgi:iron complex outermembrane receptor protein
VRVASPGAPTVFIDAPAIKQAIAGFGQISYMIAPSVQLQAGVRYTSSKSSTEGTLTLTGLAPFPVVVDQAKREADSAWTGKIGINWTINQNHYAYAFAAKGYKAGGVNAPNLPDFKPETVYDYELGLKSTLLDGRLRTQINGFYMDYRNLQLLSYIPPATVALAGANGVVNAGPAKIWGFEAQAQGRFGGLGIDLGVSHVKSRLGRTIYINSNTLPFGGNLPLGPQCANGTPVCFDYTPFTADLTGRPNPFSPEWTINAGVEYRIDTGQGSLTPRIDFSHISGQFMTVQGLAADYIPAHSLLNASLTYSQGAWTLQAYGTNLTNKTYIVGQIYGPGYFLGRPRQYGVSLGYKF